MRSNFHSLKRDIMSNKNMFSGVLREEELNLNKFFSNKYNVLRDALVTHINEKPKKKIRCSLFMFEGDFFTDEIRDMKVSIEDFQDFKKVHINRKIKHGDTRILEGIFFIKRIEGNNFIALTLEDRDFFNNGLKKYLEYLKPQFKMPSLTSKELLDIIYNYKLDSERIKINPKKTIMHNRLEEYQMGNTFHKLEDIYSYYQEENFYISKINFEMIDYAENSIVFKGAIGRNGNIEFKEGSHHVFEELLERFIKPAERKAKIFTESDKNDYQNLTKQCIKIDFRKSVLTSVKDNKRLFETISEIPQSDFIIYHYNPYLHLSYFNYSDGSRFDLVGVSDKSITILPNEGATESTFFDLIDKIGRDFADGKIEEYSPPSYSLEDVKA